MATVAKISESGIYPHVTLRDASDRPVVAATGTVEEYQSQRYPDYAIPAVEQGQSGYYVAATPAGLAAGKYRFQWKVKPTAEAVAAESDGNDGGGFGYFDGTDWWPLPAPDNAGISDAKAAAEAAAAGTDPAKLDSIYQQTQLLSGDGVQLVSPVLQGGQLLVLRRGESYVADVATGRTAIRLTRGTATWPDFAAADSLMLRLEHVRARGTVALEVAASCEQVEGAVSALVAEPTSAQTAFLDEGTGVYLYEWVAMFGTEKRSIGGKASVLPAIDATA
ncbi:MAG: hypothetical protein ACOY3P_15315 [Planctomycetota bacterium]